MLALACALASWSTTTAIGSSTRKSKPELAPGPAPPEKRITCGGNYGWFGEDPSAGVPCAPPQWDTQWALNLSTTPWTPWGFEVRMVNQVLTGSAVVLR